MAAAQTITLNGEVGDDTRAAGYLIRFAGGSTVGDGSLLAGYSIEAQDGSAIGGDVIIGALQALLAGEIGGDLVAGAEGVQIDGAVAGDVEMAVGSPGEDMPFDPGRFNPQLPPVASVPSGLTVSSGASIGGDLTYRSAAEGRIAGGAVAGDVNFELEVPEAEPEFQFRPTRPGEALRYAAGGAVFRLVQRFITLALVGLLIVWLAPRALRHTVDMFRARPWASLGIGFVGYAVGITALVAVPILLVVVGIVLGIVSLGGLTGGVIGFGALGWGGLFVGFLTAVGWLAKIVLGVWLGQLIWRAISPASASLVPPLLIGVAIIAVLMLIPVLGGLIGFVVALFGLGALILTARAAARAQPPSGEPPAAAAPPESAPAAMG